jgi:hypothetical protein
MQRKIVARGRAEDWIVETGKFGGIVDAIKKGCN